MTGRLNALLYKEVFVLNDKKMISAIIKRDEQMLAFVIQKYSKLLWKITASILLNISSVQEVEECVADVFIFLWQYPEKYNPDRAKLSSWLSMIARSKAVDRYRSLIKNKEISMEEIIVESLGYVEVKTSDEDKEELLFYIAELDEKEKELIVRRYYYEQKPAEIALALDIPKKQIENRLYYAKQKLKRCWANK
jgi:RNA polymerase sigma-70 factor (ECF subfamily)